jgi:hypothetical protein
VSPRSQIGPGTISGSIFYTRLSGGTLSPFQTACVIEMALLNCTHVVALVTPESVPSRWIPYEYGNVKEPTPYLLNPVCWLYEISSITGLCRLRSGSA